MTEIWLQKCYNTSQHFECKFKLFLMLLTYFHDPVLLDTIKFFFPQVGYVLVGFTLHTDHDMFFNECLQAFKCSYMLCC